ncbi:MAG: hypothetical protein C0490_24545 [Marivirga sp.]|nr:hypothetical protein [Marivirga sp.]
MDILVLSFIRKGFQVFWMIFLVRRHRLTEFATSSIYYLLKYDTGLPKATFTASIAELKKNRIGIKK